MYNLNMKRKLTASSYNQVLGLVAKVRETYGDKEVEDIRNNIVELSNKVKNYSGNDKERIQQLWKGYLLNKVVGLELVLNEAKLNNEGKIPSSKDNKAYKEYLTSNHNYYIEFSKYLKVFD